MVCDCEEKKERRGFWTLFVTASFFVGVGLIRLNFVLGF
jgi:hypothetical protein